MLTERPGYCAQGLAHANQQTPYAAVPSHRVNGAAGAARVGYFHRGRRIRCADTRIAGQALGLAACCCSDSKLYIWWRGAICVLLLVGISHRSTQRRYRLHGLHAAVPGRVGHHRRRHLVIELSLLRALSAGEMRGARAGICLEFQQSEIPAFPAAVRRKAGGNPHRRVESPGILTFMSILSILSKKGNPHLCNVKSL